jgi:Cu/Ag efflux pump CusA
MSEDIASRIAYLKSDADAVKAFRADMDEAIEMLLGQANNIATVAVEIERKAIEQSETVQRDWASPVEVVGMKKRIAQLESAAAWVPVAQRLPRAEKNVIVKFKDRITEMEYTRMAHLRKYPSGEYDWMEPTNAYSYGGNVIEWVNIPGDSDNA